MRLEARAECEQLLVHGNACPLAGGAGDEPEADRGRARAEPTLEWDRVLKRNRYPVGGVSSANA